MWILRFNCQPISATQWFTIHKSTGNHKKKFIGNFIHSHQAVRTLRVKCQLYKRSTVVFMHKNQPRNFTIVFKTFHFYTCKKFLHFHPLESSGEKDSLDGQRANACFDLSRFLLFIKACICSLAI